MTEWDPGQYSRFEEERARPFLDLVARIPATRAASVVDLGCGTGRLTRTLAVRWPEATVLGIDSSPEMLARAEPDPSGRVRFLQADVEEWRTRATFDVVLSNAALQWVPDHEHLIPRLAERVAPEGFLAVQMPFNFDAPSHQIIRELLDQPRWQSHLDGLRRRISVLPLRRYGEILRRCGFSVDSWETTYLHVLSGTNPVLAWVRGTALRPALSRLSPEEQSALLEVLAPRLREAYPPERTTRNAEVAAEKARGTRQQETKEVTIFPFRRIFFVASGRHPDPADGDPSTTRTGS